MPGSRLYLGTAMRRVEEIDYSSYSNNQLVIIPAVLLLAALTVVGASYATTGAPADLGFQFTGGVSVQIATDDALGAVEDSFTDVDGLPEPATVRSVTTGAVVNYPPLDDDQVDRLRDHLDGRYAESSVDTVTPAYGRSLLFQSGTAVAFAFIIMIITIFAFFRTLVPSVAVVASAFSDMVVPIAAMNLLGIKLSLATIPAVLLLIGYSIDSDILLTRNTLQGRRSEFYENVRIAMRTGVTMTLTSMAAMATMAIAAHIFAIFTLRDIGVILFIGLGTDLVNTYMMNISLLRWHVMGGDW